MINFVQIAWKYKYMNMNINTPNNKPIEKFSFIY